MCRHVQSIYFCLSIILTIIKLVVVFCALLVVWRETYTCLFKPSGKGKRLPEVHCIVSKLGCFNLFAKVSAQKGRSHYRKQLQRRADHVEECQSCSRSCVPVLTCPPPPTPTLAERNVKPASERVSSGNKPSWLPASMSLQILEEVERRREISPALVYPFMRSVMEAPFPAPGRTVTVKSFLPGSGNEVTANPKEEMLINGIVLCNCFIIYYYRARNLLNRFFLFSSSTTGGPSVWFKRVYIEFPSPQGNYFVSTGGFPTGTRGLWQPAPVPQRGQTAAGLRLHSAREEGHLDRRQTQVARSRASRAAQLFLGFPCQSENGRFGIFSKLDCLSAQNQCLLPHKWLIPLNGSPVSALLC